MTPIVHDRCNPKMSAHPMQHPIQQNGRLEVIIGGMFTGKTTELMRRLLVEAVVEKGRVLYINHSCDTRTDGDFSSHNVLFHDSLPESSGIKTMKISNLRWILAEPSSSSVLKEFMCIGIDEAQFFPELAEVVKSLVEVHNKHVIIASLSSNYKRGQNYGDHNASVLELIPLADKVNILKGKCHRCALEGKNKTSLFTFKSVESTETLGDIDTLDIGASEKYMSLCRGCYVKLSEE